MEFNGSQADSDDGGNNGIFDQKQFGQLDLPNEYFTNTNSTFLSNEQSDDVDRQSNPDCGTVESGTEESGTEETGTVECGTVECGPDESVTVNNSYQSSPYSALVHAVNLQTPPPQPYPGPNRSGNHQLNMINLFSSAMDDTVILHQTAKEIHDRASADDEMIVLFCMLIGNPDIESQMIKTYKELSQKTPQNVRLGKPKKYTVCSY